MNRLSHRSILVIIAAVLILAISAGVKTLSDASQQKAAHVNAIEAILADS